MLARLNPRKFDYAKPIKQWRETWPHAYDRMLADLRQKWPNGRGVQEFIRILQLHQTYASDMLEQAIEQALAYGCVHLDGVLYCLRQLGQEVIEQDSSSYHNLDLSHRPDLEAIGNQPVDLSVYDRLLKQSW